MSLNRNQAAAMKIARQRELQNIINEMVEKSAVLIDEHSDGGFPPKTRLTASVSILPRRGEAFDPERIAAAIRNLMTSSVAGLEADAVTVLDLRSGRAYPAPPRPTHRARSATTPRRSAITSASTSRRSAARWLIFPARS